MKRIRYYCLIITLCIPFFTHTINFINSLQPCIDKACTAFYFLASYFIPATTTELMQTKKDILDLLEHQYQGMRNAAQKNTDAFFKNCDDHLKIIEERAQECHKKVATLRKALHDTTQTILNQNIQYHLKRVRVFKDIIQEHKQKTISLYESLAHDSIAWHHAFEKDLQGKTEKAIALLLGMQRQQRSTIKEAEKTLSATIAEQKKSFECAVKERCDRTQQALNNTHNNHIVLIKNMQQQCTHYKDYITNQQEKMAALHERIASLINRYQRLKTPHRILHGHALHLFSEQGKLNQTPGIL